MIISNIYSGIMLETVFWVCGLFYFIFPTATGILLLFPSHRGTKWGLLRLNNWPQVAWFLPSCSSTSEINMARRCMISCFLCTAVPGLSSGVLGPFDILFIRDFAIGIALVARQRNRSEAWYGPHHNKGLCWKLAPFLVCSNAIALEQPSWFPSLNEGPPTWGSCRTLLSSYTVIIVWWRFD